VRCSRLHELGLKEVARIRGEMEKVKQRFGFEGELNAFFKSLDNRPELQQRVMAALPRLFERAPKAPLQIRAVEPMRRDTASDYYVPPAEDGSRPGVFYTVIQDPATYRTTGMASLFLHEGQPGHHYQMALQQELDAPKFRHSVWYDAYGEGWALYAEGLGRDIGLYDDPNAYLGRLFMELHRALRLVVDTGLHAKGWSRQQTIDYLMAMEGSTPDSARRATERYMAWPGQALAYKVGAEAPRAARTGPREARRALRHPRLPQPGAGRRQHAAVDAGDEDRLLDQQPAAEAPLRGSAFDQAHFSCSACRAASTSSLAVRPARGNTAAPVIAITSTDTSPTR
jgi:uncharacterized protein (DUF885 family)